MIPVRVDSTDKYLRVYIKEHIHVNVVKPGYFGFQAWKDDKYYCIEFYHEKGSIKAEYEETDLWLEVLRKLSTIIE